MKKNFLDLVEGGPPALNQNDRYFYQIGRTKDQLAADRAKTVKSYGKREFTCDDCPLVHICILAFDPYNTDGNCLLIK